MNLFQKSFQLVLQTNFIACELVLPPSHRAPESLFTIEHKAEHRFVRYQPFYETLSIRKIPLASASATIGLRLRQVQAPRSRVSVFSASAVSLPVLLQCSPNWPPILRRGFHYYFRDLLLAQPLGQCSQMLGTGTEASPLELVWPVEFNVGYDYGQYPFMHVDSRDLVTHKFLLAGAESVHERR